MRKSEQLSGKRRAVSADAADGSDESDGSDFELAMYLEEGDGSPAIAESTGTSRGSSPGLSRQSQ